MIKTPSKLRQALNWASVKLKRLNHGHGDMEAVRAAPYFAEKVVKRDKQAVKHGDGVTPER